MIFAPGKISDSMMVRSSGVGGKYDCPATRVVIVEMIVMMPREGIMVIV